MTTRLIERVTGGATRIDREGGVLHGVRVIGLESANGRRYTREAIAGAVPLYEGAQVNADHPSRPGEQTGLARRIGWLSGVRQDQDGGASGRLNLLLSHPLTPVVLEAAERNPRLFGLSHNASATTRREGGVEVVESIQAVHSVDLVADPATVKGLFESAERRRAAAEKGGLTFRALLERLTRRRSRAAWGLRRLLEAGTVDGDAVAVEDPADLDGDGAGADAAIRAAFREAAIAVLDDETLDAVAASARIRQILRSRDQLLGVQAAAADEPEEPAAPEVPAREPVKTSATSGVNSPPGAADPTEAILRRAAGRITEAGRKGGSGATAPTDPKAFAAWVKS